MRVTACLAQNKGNSLDFVCLIGDAPPTYCGYKHDNQTSSPHNTISGVSFRRVGSGAAASRRDQSSGIPARELHRQPIRGQSWLRLHPCGHQWSNHLGAPGDPRSPVGLWLQAVASKCCCKGRTKDGSAGTRSTRYGCKSHSTAAYVSNRATSQRAKRSRDAAHAARAIASQGNRAKSRTSDEAECGSVHLRRNASATSYGRKSYSAAGG